jgi:hypothetical protein
LTESTNCVIMESMKRIDVLKSIEQILVSKAYETGHISHRADGDCQKTNNGWVCVKGSPAQSTPQAQEPAPTENTEYGEITEEDLVDDYSADENDPIVRRMREELWSSNLANKPNDEDNEEDIFSDEAYEQDNEDRESMSAQDTVEHLIDNGDYDESFKSIEFRENDDGEEEPQDDSYFAVADAIMNDVSENYDFDEEDWEEGGDADNLYQYIVNRVIDKAYQFHTGDNSMGKAYSADEIDRIKNIGKSKIRDMRSIPTTKNMGF